ncbi:lysoplasmalogenase [Myxococcota bacterium]|nr:lysoplasmalogenase [Myxococcota bacterium]
MAMAFPALTAAAVAAVLWAEFRGARALMWIAKPLASTGFIALALSAGPPSRGYGTWVVVALALSFAGDVLLIPKGSRAYFAAGLAAFLLAHVTFALAFAALGVSGVAAGGASLLLVGVAAVVLRWLLPRVPTPLRGPVVAYVVAITAMVALAFGAAGAGAPRLIPAAAVAFFLSDLFVARERFVAPTPWNRAWGLPLYYGAQIAFAATVSGGLGA